MNVFATQRRATVTGTCAGSEIAVRGGFPAR